MGFPQRKICNFTQDSKKAITQSLTCNRYTQGNPRKTNNIQFAFMVPKMVKFLSKLAAIGFNIKLEMLCT